MNSQQNDNNNNDRNNNNNNNNNIINNIKNSITDTIQPKQPLRIVTHNVQGLTDKTKQQQLLDFLTLQKVDIMGLSETKLLSSTSRHTLKNNKDFKNFFNNDSPTPRGSGVSIIISNEYAKYIHKVAGYKGRVIFIDLIMKGRTKVRIFQIYLPATTTGLRDYTTEIYNYITTNIKEALKKKSKIILMGDFNINYEQYIRTYNRNGYTHWRDMFFKQIEDLRLIDTVSLYQDITPMTPFSTYIPKNSQISSLRINFIWISRDLIDKTLNSNIIDPTLYTSDHRAVFLSLHTRNLFKRKAIASLKQHNMRKRIYHYDQMNDDKWQEFADLVDAKHDLLDLSNMHITHRTGLNRYLDSI